MMNITQRPYYSITFKPLMVSVDSPVIDPVEVLEKLNPATCPGFLGMEVPNNLAISYWEDLESIRFWKMKEEYLAKNDEVKRSFFNQFELEISKIH